MQNASFFHNGLLFVHSLLSLRCVSPAFWKEPQLSNHLSLSLSLPQGPGQEAGPGNADPSLSQVYAPPPSYPPPGQGPPSVAGRLPPLDFSPAHAGAEYQEHAQLRVYQGPQHEGADLGPSNVVRLHMLQRVLPLSLLQDHSDELK